MSSNTNNFYHKEWNFSITYPADWEIIYQDEPAGSWMIPIAVAGVDTGGGRPCFMVNVRHGELLQGSSNFPVFGVGPDGSPIKMPSTPGEYIEMNRETLWQEFPGFKFISAEEIRLANKPASQLVYSYSGQKGRITEESITLFGVGITFQFICESPSDQYAEVQPRFQHILESFRIGRETPEKFTVDEYETDVSMAELSPLRLYNQGSSLYRNGDFEEALVAFDKCFQSGEYLPQAAYARALCQQELGLEVNIPKEFGDNAEAAGPVYVATNLVCHLIDEGHQAALMKQGKTSEVRADIYSARYRISINAGFGFGGFFKNAWRKEEEQYIMLTDSNANPNPTEQDRFITSLVERAHSLPPYPLPEEGLRMLLEQEIPPTADEVQEPAELVQPATPESDVEVEEDLTNSILSDEAEIMSQATAEIPVSPKTMPLEEGAVRLDPAFAEVGENLQEVETERRNPPVAKGPNTDFPENAQASQTLPSRTSTLATVSLVAGILSWIILPIVGAVTAVITGHLAKREIGNSKENLTGNRLAIAGLILGYGQLVLAPFVVMAIFVVMLFGPERETTDISTQDMPVMQVLTSEPQTNLSSGNWQPISSLPRYINALVADLQNPHQLFAGTGSTGSGSGVYKSEDGGLTWYLAADGLPSEDVVALALSSTQPPLLYALVGVRGDVYASADGAQSWTHLGNSGLFGGFEHGLHVDPVDSNVIFALAKSSELVRSHDGGSTWLPFGEGLPKDEHSLHALSLAIDPTNSNIIYVGTGGHVGGGHGVYKSTDGGQTWAAINQGMLDYRISALVVDSVNPQTVYAGADDGALFRTINGGQTWANISDNLPLQRDSYPSVQEIILDSSERIFLLVERAGVFVSQDGGQTWQALGNPGESGNDYSTMVLVSGSEPVLVIGARRENGGWWYGGE